MDSCQIMLDIIVDTLVKRVVSLYDLSNLYMSRIYDLTNESRSSYFFIHYYSYDPNFLLPLLVMEER